MGEHVNTNMIWYRHMTRRTSKKLDMYTILTQILKFMKFYLKLWILPSNLIFKNVIRAKYALKGPIAKNSIIETGKYNL